MESKRKKRNQIPTSRVRPPLRRCRLLPCKLVKSGPVPATGWFILTRDSGATWQNVSPPGLAEPTQILYVEASHHDPATAYLTVGATRESTPPYVARTHDYGHTWQTIVNGFPGNEMVRVVREDPKRKGLLYAGTDTGVFVSWDDGDHWQSLSLNLPPTPITDLQVHANDLVISTFGRSLWILDDLTPIRDINPEDYCRGRVPLCSGKWNASALGQLSGHALSDRNSRRPESARWRHR